MLCRCRAVPKLGASASIPALPAKPPPAPDRYIQVLMPPLLPRGRASLQAPPHTGIEAPGDCYWLLCIHEILFIRKKAVVVHNAGKPRSPVTSRCNRESRRDRAGTQTETPAFSAACTITGPIFRSGEMFSCTSAWEMITGTRSFSAASITGGIRHSRLGVLKAPTAHFLSSSAIARIFQVNKHL